MNPQTVMPPSPSDSDILPGTSLEGYNEGEAPPALRTQVTPSYSAPKTLVQRAVIPVIILAILFSLGSTAFVLFSSTRQMTPTEVQKFNQQTIDLSEINDRSINNTPSGQLAVNGGLSVSGSFQVTPNEKPNKPNVGQIFYDKERNALGYYNGTEFVYMQGGSTPTQNVDNSVSNTTIINNATQLAPPSVLLQQGSPTTAQLGNFNVNGTGTISTIVSEDANINTGDIVSLSSDVANINTGDITTLSSDTAAINVGNINTLNSDTATIGTGDITTANVEVGNITTANIDVGNINTGNIDVGNINTGNIGIVNTTQVDSEGDTFTINKFAELPSGIPVSAGEASIGPSGIDSGFNKVATKVTIGSSGGPLQSVSIYVKNAPVVGYADIFGCSCYRPHYYPLIVSIYADDGNFPSAPSALMWTTTVGAVDVAAIANDSWLTVNTDNLPMQPGSSYWVSVRVPIDQYFLNYQSSFVVGSPIKQVTNGSYTSTAASNGSSNPFGAGSYSNSLMNVTLNYVTDPSVGAAGAMFSLTPTGQASFRNTADSPNAFKIQTAASGSTIFNVDTYYGRVAIGKANADYTLDVAGDLNLSNNAPIRFGGRAALNGNATTTTISGSTIAMQGGTLAVQNAAGTTNYLTINTSTGATTVAGATTFSSTTTHTGAATFSSTATVTGATTLNGATVVNNTFTNKVTSISAFQIQNTSNINLFIADTTNMILTVGGTDTAFATLTLNNAHFKSTQTTAPTISVPTNCGASSTASVTVNSTDAAGSFTITTGNDGTSSTCNITLTFRRPYGAAPKSIIIVGKGTAAAAQRGIYVTSSNTTTFSTSFANSTAGVNSTAYEFNYWIIE